LNSKYGHSRTCLYVYKTCDKQAVIINKSSGRTLKIVSFYNIGLPCAGYFLIRQFYLDIWAEISSGDSSFSLQGGFGLFYEYTLGSFG
jgi:hypothetical protein